MKRFLWAVQNSLRTSTFTRELGQSSLESTTHPRRTAESRIRAITIHCCQIHRASPKVALSDVAHFPSEPMDLVAADFFVAPMAFFKVLFVFVILSHDRRRLVRFAASEHPTTEWVARQLLEAFSWIIAPRYLLRDRDGRYGEESRYAAKWLGFREVLTTPQSPWRNAYVMLWHYQVVPKSGWRPVCPRGKHFLI